MASPDSNLLSDNERDEDENELSDIRPLMSPVEGNIFLDIVLHVLPMLSLFYYHFNKINFYYSQ